MTWVELKNEIKDLGFETDEIFKEYETIIIHATNRAIHTIMNTIVSRFDDYFQDYFDVETGELTDITEIDTDTLDTFEIAVPNKLIKLVALLSAHYVWLDDDIMKSTLYWNEYDDLKNQLMFDIAKPRKTVISGGY